MAIPTPLNNKIASATSLSLSVHGLRYCPYLFSIPPTTKLAPKQPKTDGLSKTEEHRQINKHLNRHRKHHAPIAKKILATDRSLNQAKTAREVENELGIPKSSVVRIAAQARQRAAENNRPLQDIANYEEAPGKGRKEVFSSSQADALAKDVVSCRDCGMKTAEQHIVDLELPISVSTFQIVMYERFFSMTRCTSESYQSWQSDDARI